jgi:hypothetical protein
MGGVGARLFSCAEQGNRNVKEQKTVRSRTNLLVFIFFVSCEVSPYSSALVKAWDSKKSE